MFKTLKDARRRVVETVLVGVGASEQTSDADFDIHAQRFTAMMTDMNECGAVRITDGYDELLLWKLANRTNLTLTLNTVAIMIGGHPITSLLFCLRLWTQSVLF